MSKKTLNNTICFDYSHNNMLTIESPSYADFTQFLFGSSFRLGKVQAGITGIDKLEKYQMIVIGAPRESLFSELEIHVLETFVKQGGSLLIIHDEGGDYGANTNLNDLTQHFGFRFRSDIMFDSMNFQDKQSRITVSDFEPHPTTRNLDGIVQSSACSIELNELIEADPNIHLVPLAMSSINGFRTEWDGENWAQEIDAPRSVMASCTHYYKGRVIALCTVSMFSSLSSAYGYSAVSNQDFITSIFTWLLEPYNEQDGASRDEKLINIPVNYNLYLWMEKLVQDNSWNRVADIVNFALKFLKDDYVNIMVMGEEKKKRLMEMRKKQLIELQNIQDVGERDRLTKRLQNESEILKLGGYEVNTEKELSDIMASLSSITKGAVGTDFNINDLKQTHQKNSTSSQKTEMKSNSVPSKKSSKGQEKQALIAETQKLNESVKRIAAQNTNIVKSATKNETTAENKSLKSRADAALDAAMKSLDSFDEFTKKLDAFKTLKDSDEPVN